MNELAPELRGSIAENSFPQIADGSGELGQRVSKSAQRREQRISIAEADEARRAEIALGTAWIHGNFSCRGVRGKRPGGRF